MKTHLFGLLGALCTVQGALASEPLKKGVAASSVEILIGVADEPLAFILPDTLGASASTFCINQTFLEWSSPVYESLRTAEDLKGVDSTRTLAEERAFSAQYIRDMTSGFPKMTKSIRTVREKRKIDGKIPSVPNDLTFLTFNGANNQYRTAVSECLDSEFLMEVGPEDE